MQDEGAMYKAMSRDLYFMGNSLAEITTGLPSVTSFFPMVCW